MVARLGTYRVAANGRPGGVVRIAEHIGKAGFSAELHNDPAAWTVARTSGHLKDPQRNKVLLLMVAEFEGHAQLYSTAICSDTRYTDGLMNIKDVIGATLVC